MKNLKVKNERGITLIALIITVIILVILAAVSIRSVYNMGIVNHAVNGTAEYVEQSQKEEKMMQDTDSFINEKVEQIKNATKKNKLVDIVARDGSMYGYKMTNYSAGGVTNWSILYNDGNNVWIIADDYIDGDLSTYTYSADAVAYMKDANSWTNYVDSSIPTALAYGGPTGEMLLNSYNAKYSTSYTLGDYPRLDTTDALYVITDTSNYNAYWLATTKVEVTGAMRKSVEVASTVTSSIIPDFSRAPVLLGMSPAHSLCAWSVYYVGRVGYSGVWDFDVGLRPVVCLPSELTGEIDTVNHTATCDK